MKGRSSQLGFKYTFIDKEKHDVNYAPARKPEKNVPAVYFLLISAKVFRRINLPPFSAEIGLTAITCNANGHVE